VVALAVACLALYAFVRLFSSRAAPSLAEAPLQTGAEFDAPLWLFGTKSSESWLLPREPARKRVVVVDFSDPYAGSGDKERDWLVDNAAFLLAETLWMRTDAPATAAVIVSLPLKKIISPHDALAPWENLSGLTGSFKEPAVVAWGAANRDVAREGLTMKVRVSDETDERSFTAPYAELEKTLIDWLVGRGLCGRTDPPAWYAPPKPAQLPLWAIVHHNLQLQTLADAKNGVLAPLDADFQDDLVDYALDAVEQLEGAGEQVKLAAIACAVYARRAGALKEERRTKILEIVAGLSAPDLVRLSPRFYHALGEPARADAVRTDGDAYRASSTEAYRAWLREIRDA